MGNGRKSLEKSGDIPFGMLFPYSGVFGPETNPYALIWN